MFRQARWAVRPGMPVKSVAIRADASTRRGIGHVMRCLSLADELKWRGVRVRFLCWRAPGHLCDWIAGQGYEVYTIGTGEELAPPETLLGEWLQDARESAAVLALIGTPDWLIVDHYGLDERWESFIRPFAARVMAIDDLANRPHDCDLLLDQNYYEHMIGRYDALIPSHCCRLLGPEFALLRPEFANARQNLRVRDGRIVRLLCFFGGADPTNETEKLIAAFGLIDAKEVSLDVIVGAGNPHLGRIESLCSMMPNVSFHCQIANMAELMAKADLAIGAGGGATWERCCVGLPAVVSILADNQVELTEHAAHLGVLVNLGRARHLTARDYHCAIAGLGPERLLAMSARASELVDGQGCRKVADTIMNFR